MQQTKLICLFTLFLFFGNNSLNAQNVNIPDANFKAALVANSAINTNADTEIQVIEAQAFTGQMDVASKNISDLTGIEAFTALTQLFCYSNQLTTIDISANIALTYLECDHNQLTSLNVSSNTALSTLLCGYNQLTALDVSTNTALVYLLCGYNQLTALDISTNTALVEFRCYYNQLTTLDISQNTALTTFYCDSNQLVSLNVQNGNNLNLGTNYFSATGNPNLLCIQVDSVAYSVANWTYIDPASSFSADCSTFNNINTISAEKINLTASPNPTTGILNLNFDQLEEDFTIEVRNIMGQLVSSKNQTPTSSLEIELTGASGIYFVTVKTNKSEAVLKVVKE